VDFKHKVVTQSSLCWRWSRNRGFTVSCYRAPPHTCIIQLQAKTRPDTSNWTIHWGLWILKWSSGKH